MTPDVVITPVAEANLDEILHFIALDNPAAAHRFITALKAKMTSLAAFPERCPLAPEDGLDGMEIRHLVYGAYRILFTIDSGRVVIMQVRHAARRPMARR